ncbi:SIMPL domain-containing protein [Subsaximicrobium wynnwilliamsii]|uniref:SIMPL domain-containing protein n=1 Tax=Subsaximicrobium wynnwilliamsii TaxID=291179 RepID=A0A5C6ZCV4_9FLAO|nr:SIMPL domain-containing protein [Subsaximicrobium wynnwilliamsii]TXD80736.1 SIMPL domain-containing protein [Subsaximicrobium wynnwilliamsii]TXD86494.1 SIMPL domain-containing protein [Subsaximicrobium wynnwilliamsii]TXD99991.1 SIMPL domain-containing protein [Subsaximicrobium wynnwilliamsii]
MNRILLILGLILTCQISNGQTKNFIDQPYLETIAKVDTLIKPDIIYLDILIREKDERNRIPVEEMESKMIQKLKSLGINTEKQLTLSDLASNFKKYFLKQKDIMKDKAYELKVFDSQTAGKVLVALEEIGISNVNLDRTEYSKMEELKLELKAKAVEKARTQADFLVRPLNQKVTRAIHITDKYYETYNNFSGELQEVVVMGYSNKGKQEYEPPTIEFRPIKVESEVSIKFAIE